MVTEQEAKNGYRVWTPEDDAALLGARSRKAAAFLLDRTVAAINSRVRWLRLQEQKRAESASVPQEAGGDDDDEGKETTLESAVAGMNHNAEVIADLARMLREERSKYDELKRVFELVVFNLNLLLEFHCTKCANGPLSDAVKGFLASVEMLGID